MATLEDAIALAADAHRGQCDRGGEPYILHPLRVMLSLEGLHERMAAVLHDVVEDTHWTVTGLQEAGFPDEVVEAVDALSKREGEPYDAYVDRVARCPLARTVKLADLKDNMDLSRISSISERDRARQARYRRAMEVLTTP